MVPIGFAQMLYGAISVMITDSCTGQCDTAAIDLGIALAVQWMWLPLVAGIIATLVVIVVNKRAWWIPLAAMACSFIVFIIGISLVENAVP